MKIVTVVGTRPELIRLSGVIKQLDVVLKDDHILVYTNQNYEVCLSDVFFQDLNIRKPNYTFNNENTTGIALISKILSQFEEVVIKEKPNRMLVLGDTNSCLTAYVAKKYNVKVYHMEAGNRCFSDIVPEEVNRRIIDHISDINMPYTERSKQNLLAEGISNNKIFVVGNPIYEIINQKVLDVLYYTVNHDNKIKLDIENSIEPFNLVTIHRKENVSDKAQLLRMLDMIDDLSEFTSNRCIVSLHPTTLSKIKQFALDFRLRNSKLQYKTEFITPVNFTKFVFLELFSKYIMTDSGTVQEEASILRKKCIVVRANNERLETLEEPNCILVGNYVLNKSVIEALEKVNTERIVSPYNNEKSKNVTQRVVSLLVSEV